MSDKRGDAAGKALGALAAIAAGYGTRKLVTAGWKQLTGKEPPSDPHDPQVRLREALSWAIAVGVAMETARLLAQRAVTRRLRDDGETAGD
ncbi:MAG TPA: DUF4235 domain-containing protein [Streptosporangiaceae bacterium]|jgi:hypothetical protein|nr:DUF4235 domain-containing protein [Streptosporangiaceae bacterium]